MKKIKDILEERDVESIERKNRVRGALGLYVTIGIALMLSPPMFIEGCGCMPVPGYEFGMGIESYKSINRRGY